MNDEEDQHGYTWEAGYTEGLNIREVLEEDEGGSVEKAIARLVAESRRRRRDVEKPARMRYVIVVVDCSRSMADKALPPTRAAVTRRVLDEFFLKFFDQNPLAQVGVVVCRDRKAERLVPLTGNMHQLRQALSSLDDGSCSGEFSLQNGLQLALQNLQDLPGHVSKETITIMSSLSTCDPGNIFNTFEQMKSQGVRCSVVGLSAELFVCKRLAEITSGRYEVCLDAAHFESLLVAHSQPSVATRAVEVSALRVGFPPHTLLSQPSFCLCHQSSSSRRRTFGGGFESRRGYLCEQCGARSCSLPSECRVCRLTLVAAPQLARAAHHLAPLPPFEPVSTVTGSPGECAACGTSLEEKAFQCGDCGSRVCFDCDILLHESLQICPLCS